MAPCPDKEMDLEDYWRIVRGIPQEPVDVAETAVEAMFRVLEALNVRLMEFDDRELDKRLSKIEVSRLSTTKEWQLTLTAYKPQISEKHVVSATSQSFSSAVSQIFDAVVSDFQADLNERDEEADSTERKLLAERRSIRVMTTMKGLLGTYIPEQLGLFKSNNPIS
jgi:hypothetical protein